MSAAGTGALPTAFPTRRGHCVRTPRWSTESVDVRKYVLPGPLALALDCICSSGRPLSIGSCPDSLEREQEMLLAARLLQEDNQIRALPLAVLGEGFVKQPLVCYAKALHRFDNDVSTR